MLPVDQDRHSHVQGSLARGYVLSTSPSRAQVEQRRAVLPYPEHPEPGRMGRHRTAVRRSGDHPGALDVPTGMWGGGQSPGGARGPQPPIRPSPSGCCTTTD